jgi:hypothetical protein
MTRSDEVDQLLRECAAVSDKLNNLLTGIHLKAGMLMTNTADEYVTKGMHEISAIAEEAPSYSAMLRRLSDKTRTA